MIDFPSFSQSSFHLVDLNHWNSRPGFHLVNSTIKAFNQSPIRLPRPLEHPTSLSFGRPYHQSFQLDSLRADLTCGWSMSLLFGRLDTQLVDWFISCQFFYRMAYYKLCNHSRKAKMERISLFRRRIYVGEMNAYHLQIM
jgi:hypothetical protein